MKPTTVINIIMYITACLMLMGLILVTGASESRCRALRDTFFLKDAQILRLKEENIRLRTLDGAVRVFDMVLPESYRAELAQIDHILQQKQNAITLEIRYKPGPKSERGDTK